MLLRNRVLIIINAFMILFVVLVSTPVTVFAQSTPQQNRDSIINRREAYDPNEVFETCEGGQITLDGKDNIEKIWNFFSDPSKNLKEFQVAGIMGNIEHESGFQPQRLQGTPSGTVTTAEDFKKRYPTGGPGWGLVQFTPGSKFIDTQTPTSKANQLETQLNFVWEQLLGKGPLPESTQILKDIRETTTVEDAVVAFQGGVGPINGKVYGGYERPADKVGSVADRVAAAKLVLSEYQGKTPGSAAVGDSCGLDSTDNSLSSLLLEYAWPDYNSAPFLEMKPAYKKAVDEAIADGRYVGGTRYKGIDCGGFVTLLLTNSNYEPDYNYAGKGGFTGIQEEWAKANWEQIFPKSTADHKLGDVAINATHTYIYVGDKISDFNSDTASASLDQRTPRAGTEQPADPDFRWYRKK